jgi:transposase
MEEIFSQALGIVDPWFIKSVNFDVEKKRLDINIDFKRGSTFSDSDEDLGSLKEYKVYDTIKKSWRHLNFFEHECYLNSRTPRIKRDDGKIRLIMPPWSGKVNGFTLLFEALMLQLCKNMPAHQVAKIVGTSDHKLWTMLDVYVGSARFFADFSEVDAIGIDETSVARGHDYISLFVDLKERKTIHISDGKGADTVKDFVVTFEEHSANKEQVKDVSCDMSPAFISGVKNNLPNARITFDKFHVMKIINGAVDQVRRDEAKTNPLLKKTRYIFLKNEENLTKKQLEKKQELLDMKDVNLKSITALQMRENFQQIYHADDEKTFVALLESWYLWVSKSGMDPMEDAAKTIKNHLDGIVAWKESQINNGILEGLNSVIQAAKRKARGYGRIHFKTIAYLMKGKLDFTKINKNYLPT